MDGLIFRKTTGTKKTRSNRRWFEIVSPWPNAANLMGYKLEWIEPCPFGQVGDRLWGRETWFHENDSITRTFYRAETDDDGTVPYLVHGSPFGGGVGSARIEKWRPSTQMPRWASRILLEIVSVRVERLQDISRDDALAQGATSRPNCTGYSSRNEGWSLDWSRVRELSHFGNGRAFGKKVPLTEQDLSTTTPEFAFASMWLDEHGVLSWHANPYVWVVEFKRVAADE